MTKPRIKVTLTDLEGTVLDQFTVEPMDRDMPPEALAKEAHLVWLAGKVLDTLSHRFETEDDL